MAVDLPPPGLGGGGQAHHGEEIPAFVAAENVVVAFAQSLLGIHDRVAHGEAPVVANRRDAAVIAALTDIVARSVGLLDVFRPDAHRRADEESQARAACTAPCG